MHSRFRCCRSPCVRTSSEQFNARPAEIRRLLRVGLEVARTRELTKEMLVTGLPL